MTPPQIVQPDPVYRRRVLLFNLLLVLAIGIGLWLLAASFERWRAGFDPDDPQAVAAFLDLAWWVLVVGPLPFLGLALWLVWLARRIWRTERFPLPGQKVLRPTLLRTGLRARRLAGVLALTGLVLLTFILTSVLFSLRLLDYLASLAP